MFCVRVVVVMKRVILLLSVVGMLGCAATVWYGSPSKLKSHTLGIGMSTQQVQVLLGPPQSVMSQQRGDLLIETWKYLDKIVTFHNGVVYSWGAGPDGSGPGSGGTSAIP